MPVNSSDLNMITAPASANGETLAEAVAIGLSATRKHLPCRFFYDEAGSALFEKICDLPEYYATRTERTILAKHADEILAATGARSLVLIELGSGSSSKTRLLIDAALRRQRTLQYIPIDISGAFLEQSARALLETYPCLSILAIAAEYREGLRSLPEPDAPRLFVFLGGNIGNFEFDDAISLLHNLRLQMRPADRLLVGLDRVKDVRALHAAYNDSAGVTAAFNKNLLSRINRELGADFDTDRWTHAAPFIQERSRIEMWLVSDTAQEVRIGDKQYAFAAGERIHTENSHKYTPGSFGDLSATAGLCVEHRWSDADEWFTLALLRPAPGRASF